VIGDYTGGHYTEGWQAADEPVGPMQRFRWQVNEALL
jgi:hypothetical protein